LTDYLKPCLSGELRNISVLGIAHVGDAVYELMVRTWLCSEGTATAKKLHGEAVTYVSAKAQSVAAKRLLPMLNENEHAIYKRGRNAYVNSVPRGSTFEEYHAATGIETVFGHLYLTGDTERLNELFEIVISEQ